MYSIQTECEGSSSHDREVLVNISKQTEDSTYESFVSVNWCRHICTDRDRKYNKNLMTQFQEGSPVLRTRRYSEEIL